MNKSKLENKTTEQLRKMLDNRQETLMMMENCNLPSEKHRTEYLRLTRSIEQLKAKLGIK